MIYHGQKQQNENNITIYFSQLHPIEFIWRQNGMNDNNKQVLVDSWKRSNVEIPLEAWVDRA